MDRSRSKRYYHDQDYKSETLHSRSKPRYGSNSQGGGGGGGGGGHYSSSYHRKSASGMGGGGGGRKLPENSAMVTTSYRILCHDVKAGGVIGKSGSIIKSIRQHTGAWINVHELVAGDEERIIEISDTRRRDPDGRIPSFSPAQEALILIHDRILENEIGYMGIEDEENDEYRSRGGAGGNKVVTRLVVSRMHVGCLLGKGGKIIEQMKMETKTHIRILPRDHTLPNCIGMAEEIVQVVGDANAVKAAIAVISSRLRESQHRDRSHFHNRMHSPERPFPDDDFRMNGSRRLALDGPSIGSRYIAGSRKNSHSFRSSGFAYESGASFAADDTPSFSGEDLVFRILCPADKIDRIIGESDSILTLLEDEIGIGIDLSDPIAGSDERAIIISSDEDPDDEMFPSQEALLHIQTRIVDLIPEKENVITTRLLLQTDQIASFRDVRSISGADLAVLPVDKLPDGVSGNDEILQIAGEIKSAREALLEVTSQIRSHVYRDFFEGEDPVSNASIPSITVDTTSSNNVVTPSMEKQAANPSAAVETQKNSAAAAVETVKQNESERREEPPSGLTRISIPLITKSTLEIVIPPHAAAALAKKSKKLTCISELSGATVKLMNDNPDAANKIIQVSGTPEQAERAQSLLQGFILSTDEDSE